MSAQSKLAGWAAMVLLLHPRHTIEILARRITERSEFPPGRECNTIDAQLHRGRRGVQRSNQRLDQRVQFGRADLHVLADSERQIVPREPSAIHLDRAAENLSPDGLGEAI